MTGIMGGSSPVTGPEHQHHLEAASEHAWTIDSRRVRRPHPFILSLSSVSAGGPGEAGDRGAASDSHFAENVWLQRAPRWAPPPRVRSVRLRRRRLHLPEPALPDRGGHGGSDHAARMGGEEEGGETETLLEGRCLEWLGRFLESWKEVLQRSGKRRPLTSP